MIVIINIAHAEEYNALFPVRSLTKRDVFERRRFSYFMCAYERFVRSDRLSEVATRLRCCVVQMYNIVLRCVAAARVLILHAHNAVFSPQNLGEALCTIAIFLTNNHCLMKC